MNTQRLQNYAREDFVYDCNRGLDGIFCAIRAYVDRIRLIRERKALYRRFKMLDDNRLRDIGMHDPQAQLKVLGRYL